MHEMEKSEKTCHSSLFQKTLILLVSNDFVGLGRPQNKGKGHETSQELQGPLKRVGHLPKTAEASQKFLESLEKLLGSLKSLWDF